MAETIPGGRYLTADGRTYVDASGRPVDAPTRKERADHAEQRAEAERLTQQAAEQQAVTETPATRRGRG